MKYCLFYILPLVAYAYINNRVVELFWPHFLVLLLSFLLFQMARLKYPKNAMPVSAKLAQFGFYLLTISLIVRDRFLDTTVINGLLIAAAILAIIDTLLPAKQPSA